MDLGGAFLSPIEQDQRIQITADKEQREKDLAPARLAHEVAQTRSLTAQANKLEAESASERTAAAMMLKQFGGASQAEGVKPPPISQQLSETARIWAVAGNPVKAAAALAQASTAESHETGAENARRMANTAALNSRMKMGELMANLAGGITDQASMDAANAAFEQQTGQKSPFAGVMYNPGMVKAVADSGIKMKDRAKLALDRERLDSLEARRDQQAATEDAKLGIMRARLALQRERTANVKKVGGNDVGSPSGPEQKAAKALLSDLVDAADLETAAYDVASQARTFRKANPGLSADDAMRAAVEAKRVAGDFTVTKTPPRNILGMDIPFTGGDPKKTYSVNALPLPKSKNPADLKTGQLYSANGKTMMWTGKGWTQPKAPANAPKPKARGAAPADEEDDDEED